MMNKNDLGKAFEDFKRYVFQRYNGTIIRPENGGWFVPSLKGWYPTYDDACYGIDKNRRELLELIKMQNPQP
jgi:hypothetical protein